MPFPANSHPVSSYFLGFAHEKMTDLFSTLPPFLLKTKLFCVVVTDLEGKCVYVNEVFQNRFAHLAIDLVGHDMRETVGPADLGQYELAQRKCVAHPGEVVAVTLRAPDGQGGFLGGLWEFSLLPDPDLQPIGILCLGQDAPQASDVLGWEVLDTLPSHHLLLGPDAKIINMNQPAAQWFGAVFGHQLRQGGDFAHFAPKSLFPDFRNDFAKALGGDLVTKQTSITASNGEVHWFEYSLAPVLGHNNQCCGVALHLASIAPQKSTGAAQKELELILRAMLDNSSSSSIAVSRAGNLLVLNRKAKEEIRLYYNKDAAEGEDFWQYVPKGALIEVRKLFDRAFNGFPSNIEAQIDPGDGTTIWREVSYSPVYDAQDNAIGVSITGTNIEKRLVAQQSKLDSESKLRAILDNMLSNMVLISPDFKVLSINKQAKLTASRFFGNEDIAEGEDFWEYVVPGTERDFMHDFGRALAGERVELERALVNSYGQTFWLAFSYFPVYDAAGQILGVAFNSLDITKRKQAENDLRETERRLHLLASNFPDGSISLIDQDLKFLYTDGSAYQQLGLSPSAYIGRPIQDVLHPKVYQEITAALPHLPPDGNHSFELILGGRTYRHTLRTTARQPSSPNYFVLASVDITERKANEAKVQARNALLAKIAWQQSHVVRRPLANLLESDPDPSEQGQFLAYLKLSALELDQIIHDIVAQTFED